MGTDDLVRAEVCFPTGPVDWEICPISFSPGVEYLAAVNDHGCRILFDGPPPSGMEAGMPCVVFLQDQGTGRTRLFGSVTVAVTPEAVFIRPPKEFSPEKRKKRFKFGLSGTIIAKGVPYPVTIADVSQGLAGMGIRSARPVFIFPGEQVAVVFTHGEKRVLFGGRVVWALRNLRFGLAGKVVKVQ